MKVLVTRDSTGILVWKEDAKPVYVKQEGFRTKQWYSDKYWFDFNAIIFGYNKTYKMFPQLNRELNIGECKEMMLVFVNLNK